AVASSDSEAVQGQAPNLVGSAVESPISESVQAQKPEPSSPVAASPIAESMAAAAVESPPTRPARRTTRRAVAETPVQLPLDAGTPESQAAAVSPVSDSQPVVSAEAAPAAVADLSAQPRPVV